MQQNIILVIVLAWFSTQVTSKSVTDHADNDNLAKLEMKTFELESKIAGVKTEVCALEAKMKEKKETVQNQLEIVKADVTNIMTLVEGHNGVQAALREDIDNLVQRLDNQLSTPGSTVPTDHDVCPDGWVKYDRYCLYFALDPVTWNVAKSRCQSDDAHLLEVDTEEMNTFLKIRLRRSAGFGHFVGGLIFGRQSWIWDYTNTEFVYTDWGPNQPSRGRDSHCLVICSGASCQWDDLSCDYDRFYICQ
ncbi:C-type lectin domain family 4 member K-like, partial [Mizuhopecten yessoensis]|uniref:C-type lectin domain family 4 member K-like n=1 Tax=Mizuhopecten yessoensis TaxID=6573 RepID=UPI000B45C42C